MITVVRQFVPRQRVQENHQAVAVQRQPRQHHTHHLRPERQLAAPVRVRPDRLAMHAPHGHGKQPGRLLTQVLCLRLGVCIEIHMGVIALDPLHTYLL
ncbi:hypothetical protein D3C85_1704590 [compost metagenome]